MRILAQECLDKTAWYTRLHEKSYLFPAVLVFNTFKFSCMHISSTVQRRELTVAKLGRYPPLCIDIHLLVIFSHAVFHSQGRTVAVLKLGIKRIFRIQIHIVQHNDALRSPSLPGKKVKGGKCKTNEADDCFRSTPLLMVFNKWSKVVCVKRCKKQLKVFLFVSAPR